MAGSGTRPRKVLFAHVPKAAGVHLIETFTRQVGYPRIQSRSELADGVWVDFTIEELREYLDAEHAFLHTHVLAYGWSSLVDIIPPATREQTVDAVRSFRANGWYTISFVRHPGELLCSFYHYVLDAHERGRHAAVSHHAPVLDRSLDEFVAEHCDRDLVPDYWKELDFVGEACDETFTHLLVDRFCHEYDGSAPSHASGSRGFEYYCETGVITPATRARVEASRNMAVYREIVASSRPRRAGSR